MAVLGAGGGDGLHGLHAGPVAALDAQFVDALGGDEAVVDRFDLVGAVAAQARLAGGRVDGVLDAGAPPRDLAGGQLVALGGHHGAVPAGLLGGEAGEPLQLFGDHLGLEAALGARFDVLPVAAAAAAGAGVRAGCLDAVLGRLEDLHGVGAQEAGALLALRDACHDPLAGQGVPDEQHLAAVGAGDAVAAVGDGADLDLVLLAHQRLVGFCLHGELLQIETGKRRGRSGSGKAGRQPTSLRGWRAAFRHEGRDAGVAGTVVRTSVPWAPSAAPGRGRAAPSPARSIPGAGGPGRRPPRRRPAGRARR